MLDALVSPEQQKAAFERSLESERQMHEQVMQMKRLESDVQMRRYALACICVTCICLAWVVTLVILCIHNPF